MSRERLQKILARAGAAESRRKAEELLRAGRVTVNGRVAELGESADPVADAIKLDGKRVQLPAGRHYLLLNKPDGVMSTRSDPEGRPTVMDLVPAPLRKTVVPVGRLDFHSEGLLVLTDDGDFAQHLAHPRHGSLKTYEVKVKGEPRPEEIERLRTGVVIEGRRTAPAKIVRLAGARGARLASHNTWWKVELGEGRTRQIREMFFRIGHPVQRLKRVAVGPLRDPHLRPGQVRELTEEEVELLREGGPQRGRPAPRSDRTRPGKKAPGPGKKAPGKTGPGKKGPGKPGPGKPGPGKRGPGKPGPGKKGLGKKGPGKGRPSPGRPGKAAPAKGRGAPAKGSKGRGPKRHGRKPTA